MGRAAVLMGSCLQVVRGGAVRALISAAAREKIGTNKRYNRKIAIGATSMNAKPACRIASQRTVTALRTPCSNSASPAAIDKGWCGARKIHSPSRTYGMINSNCVGAMRTWTSCIAARLSRNTSAIKAHKAVDNPRIGMLPTTMPIATHSARRSGDMPCFKSPIKGSHTRRRSQLNTGASCGTPRQQNVGGRLLRTQARELQQHITRHGHIAEQHDRDEPGDTRRP